jgi:uncharacterized protein YgiM (DUF1202 family)
MVLMVVLLMSMGVLLFGGTAMAAPDEQQAEFVPPRFIVNTSFLNIRTGPSTAYPILLTVVGGTELPALGSAGDGVWYQVSTVAGVGWINASFAIARGDFRNVPVVEAPPLEPFDPDQFVTGAPSSDDATNTAVAGSGRGWGLSIITTHPSRLQPTINSSSPGDAVQNLGTIYQILGAATGDGTVWYQTDLPSLGTVWLEAGKVRLRPFACTVTAVVMNASVAPIGGPDGSGTLDGNLRLNPGDEAYLIDRAAGQFKIALFDGNTGWIRETDADVRSDDVVVPFCETGGGAILDFSTGGGDVADQQPGAQAPQQQLRSPARVIINTGFLNIRSGPGSQFTVVATLPGGTTLDVIGFAPDGVWYLVTGPFGRGWLNSEFTIFRGNGTTIPVIRDATGELSRPRANITNAITLYSAPTTNSTVVGAVSGPLEVPVVARTPDNGWVQLNTTIGFGWVQSGAVNIAGDLSLLPVVGG